MVSNDEIKLRLECKKEGLDPDKTLGKIQVPYEWTGASYLFNFGSMPVEEVTSRIDKLLTKRGYSLEDGTLSHGVCIKLTYSGVCGDIPKLYRFEFEIYSSRGRTYFTITKSFKGLIMAMDKIWNGKNYLDSELEKIVNKIKYLKPFKGYLVCNKCNKYYKLQFGESPYDFTDKCECGGKLKYYENIDFLLK
ncbi:MAG: hypothetical protein KO316_01460 [Methanobacterium sp.]|nr:hypothetical protein [Methanobacterium sp.]